MPDWSYTTTSQPILFRLPPKTARDVTLNVMGRLARLPFGGQFIDFLGHMRADSRLGTEVADIHFPTPVGLGIGVDINAIALPALERFGFGFIEVGPITRHPQPSPTVTRDAKEQTIAFSDLPTLDLETLRPRLLEWRDRTLPYLVRLTCPENASAEEATAECCECIEALASHSDLFSSTTITQAINGQWTEEAWVAHVNKLLTTLQKSNLRLLLVISTNVKVELIAPLLQRVCDLGVSGVVIQGTMDAETGGYWIGASQFDAALSLVKGLRQKWVKEAEQAFTIVVSGGIHEPRQALDMVEAGADLVQVDSGLVYTGPGLPKRINEAILYAGHHNAEHCAAIPAKRFTNDAQPETQITEEKWFWTTLLAVAMLVGGLLALFLGTFGVILPYDEEFVGMTRAELAAINDRLLPFMAHDRITLAGSMLALGIFYLGLSYYGIRRGVHWACVTLLYSALAGFASFFLFLGFGYFDPFHAFVTTILFQFVLMGLHTRLPAYTDIALPSLKNDLAWRRSLWSQYLFILQGIGIIGAGLYISAIGITVVFVAEDLAFMQTTAEALRSVNPRLIPLVAHDRATLGGMLISGGIAIFLSALWGYRPGERWLWWSLLLGCCVAYGSTLAVHLVVGYTDLLHLSPVFAGIALTFVASWLSYGYLCVSGREEPVFGL
ncbi:MAG: dihydroorotate dehydrogenase [Chloroflexota bacterium]